MEFSMLAARTADNANRRGMRLVPLAIAVAALALSGCAGYVPGQKAYWDARVRDLCEKDGGVRIFEKLRVSGKDIAALGGSEGNIAIPIKELASPSAPAYSVLRITYIKEGNPQVSRQESTIVRRADQAVLAQWVLYSRSGGEMPGPGHPSVFTCPQRSKIADDLQQLFVVVDSAK